MTVRILSLIISVLLIFYCNISTCFAFETSAKSAIVINALTGEVVYEKNARQKLPMASTTKIMTAICAIENGNLDEIVKVHPKAVGVEGSSMYLGHDEQLPLRDLLYGLMLSSGNDAAVAIAIHISKSVEEFALLMNKTAEKIGVKNTSFKNPNGLDDEGHYTTAYDLAMITRYGMKNPEFSKVVGTQSIKVGWQGRDYPRVLNNHNKLLKMYEGATGVKTGFTKKSGRCLVSSAKRDGLEFVAVTLNAPDDWNDHIKMLDFAFDAYESKEIIKKDEYLKTLKVLNGNVENISVASASSFSVPVKKGSKPKIKLKYNIPETTEAPVGFGKVLGSVEVYLDDSLAGKVDAVSKNSVSYVEPETFLKNIIKIFKTWILMNRVAC